LGNAVTSVRTSATTVADALARARELDQPAFITLADSASVPAPGAGPLAGMPFAIKDNIDVAGFPSTAAWPRRSEMVTASATVIQRLVAAGAIPIGKTNMDQFATGLVGTRSPYGACHSSYSDKHVSGGSSSGSAVAVATGVVPFALGTDTAGSGRVPAAFNGLIGLKPTRGLISNFGILPACPSLDCVAILTGSVALARTVLAVAAGPDPADPYSRAAPSLLPGAVARSLQVIAVPAGEIDLDPLHRVAWEAALAHAATVGRVVEVDVSAMLEVARLLYSGPYVAERLAAFGHLLMADDPELDPTVRTIVLGAQRLTAVEVFQGEHRLKELAAQIRRQFNEFDAMLLPTTPGHPTLAEVAADPIGVNSRLGTYTNMVNLLDMCTVAVPAGMRADGLPFGVQLIAPAFADGPLLDLASRWCGEDVPAVETQRATPGHTLVAVAGAHLSGEPLNWQLVQAGGRLHSRTSTAEGYRMYLVRGPVPRPGLVDSGDGGPGGIELELWDLPHEGVGQLLESIASPLGLGRVRLTDGGEVIGFVADASALSDATDITEYRGWRRWRQAH
jgi:allophanate hydrolase